jgi:hypothetical protein
VSETQLYELECQLVALFAGALLLRFVVRGLRRSRPSLAIGKAIGVAFGLRLLAALALNQLSLASQLRGGDEFTFIGHAQALTRYSFGSSPVFDEFTNHFHVFFFSLNYRIFDHPPQMMLRIELIALAVCGVALMSAAVYELAGARAAMIAAWVLALEPASIFFSGILHKEPFMMLAEGLATYGGARLWKKGDYRALVPMVIGCLLAAATRPYVGWFLAAGCAVLAFHAGLRRNSASSSFVLAAVVVALAVAFFPTVWDKSSSQNLKTLQISQEANASDTSANLSLERVDYSTRGKIVVNLPTRILDIATKPYPWQIENTSQQLGAFGSLFLLATLALLIWTLWTRGARGLMGRAGPLIYPMLFLLVAYALSAGNAGTAFRYRTHIVAFLIALVVVLRFQDRQEKVAADDRSSRFRAPWAAVRAPTLAK